MPDYYTKKSFDNPEISYGFFTRCGGVSQGVYEGLNCGFGSNDDPENIAENRARVARQIGAHHLLGPYQVHGAKVITVEKPFTQRPKADALVTNQPNIAISVLTADCAPVLFHGDGVIGAAHAGWKGALYGVLDNTIKAMQDLGASDISACVGPCIGVESYEISPEFKKPFIQENANSAQFFKGKYFNLPEYCAWRLRAAGVQTPEILDKDTYIFESDFYSYRRATHRRESDYGRQISAIMIKNGT